MADNNTTWGTGRQLLELESVQRAIDEAAAWAGTEYARMLRGSSRALIGWKFGGSEMESPIEAIFWTWFGALSSFENNDIYMFILSPQRTITLGAGKTYRFDFLVDFGPPELLRPASEKNIAQPKVAIELDGHDFHERTKEQVAYRNERDRYVQAEGWTILHFSGSELYRDPLKCARAVVDVCRTKTDAWRDQVYSG